MWQSWWCVKWRVQCWLTILVWIKKIIIINMSTFGLHFRYRCVHCFLRNGTCSFNSHLIFAFANGRGEQIFKSKSYDIDQSCLRVLSTKKNTAYKVSQNRFFIRMKKFCETLNYCSDIYWIWGRGVNKLVKSKVQCSFIRSQS